MTSLSWSSVCIKYLMFIFNLLFVVSGIIILSVGITIKAYYHDYELFLDDQYFSTPNLLIAIGTIIFIIAFFGCCGAVKENFCMTVTFSTLLILIFVLEFAAGISGYVLRNQTGEFLTQKLTESLEKYNASVDDPITKMWDEIQIDFECCGVHNYTDWEKVYSKLPASCCGPQHGLFETTVCNRTTSTLYSEGCLEKFGTCIEDNAVTIGSVGLGLAFIQLLGIIFSCHLSRQIKKNYETV
ncbi:hypothetical protein ILUMI_02397 [Ignelater luminosus]|uniref:Tetraspanin n=1 Tax=Ignelater luminosus TaxID=2038154 RepID=A0A8K0DGJ0_IGNLU|nr:hypothetical protein ILUMI_02397 [Ignelater luminosus]